MIRLGAREQQRHLAGTSQEMEAKKNSDDHTLCVGAGEGTCT